MAEKYSSLDDLVHELEDEGHNLRYVIVDRHRVLIPREELDDDEED